MATPAGPNEHGDPPPRRVVLLATDEQSAVLEVVCQYSGTNIGATRIHADLIRAAEEHPGQFAAVEWLSPIGWTRYLWCRR